MSEIIKTTKSLPNLRHLIGATETEISDAEIHLHLRFAKEYKQFLSEFGSILTEGIEIIGVAKDEYGDVISVTKQEWEFNPLVPRSMYVIESLGIDGIIIWQDSSGAIYQSSPYQSPEKIFDSLVEYIKSKESDEVTVEKAVTEIVESEYRKEERAAEMVITDAYRQSLIEAIEEAEEKTEEAINKELKIELENEIENAIEAGIRKRYNIGIDTIYNEKFNTIEKAKALEKDAIGLAKEKVAKELERELKESRNREGLTEKAITKADRQSIIESLEIAKKEVEKVIKKELKIEIEDKIKTKVEIEDEIEAEAIEKEIIKKLEEAIKRTTKDVIDEALEKFKKEAFKLIEDSKKDAIREAIIKGIKTEEERIVKRNRSIRNWLIFFFVVSVFIAIIYSC
jgi:hypothetical protein